MASFGCSNIVLTLAVLALLGSCQAAHLRRPDHERSRLNATANQIVFIKTHATGSSTVTNILHRICSTYDLSCFAPPAANPGQTFDREGLERIVRIKERQHLHWDIWSNHVIMEPQLLNQIIPNHTTIAIFRNPVDRVVSSFAHDPDILKQAVKDLQHNIIPTPMCGSQWWRMSMQVPLDMFHQLDTVMLTESMDTSLLMLQQKYGWRMRDIVHLDLKNSSDLRGYKGRLRKLLGANKSDMNRATKQVVAKCIPYAEKEIYRRAEKKFYEQKEELRVKRVKEMRSDLIRFKEAQAQVTSCCAAHAADPFCGMLLADNVEWVQAHQPVFASKGGDSCAKFAED